ncbi:MAG: DUF1294 domain-containing protein [archaeon]|nr:DUF1294 domain-containing protein [archaeon]
MNGWFTLFIILLVLNVVVALVYAYDKHKAVAGEWRIRERTLIILGLFGPFGAVIGMKLFHHKTQKPKFKLNYVFLFLHIAIVAYVIYKVCC